MKPLLVLLMFVILVVSSACAGVPRIDFALDGEETSIPADVYGESVPSEVYSIGE